MIDPALFRAVMSRFASGVTVVTTSYEGVLYGLTVSSFASLSFEPRLALVCIDQQTRNYTALTQSGVFGINILAANQTALSQHFAGKNKDQWDTIAYSLGSSNGVPLLDGALAQLECRVAHLLPGGDHTIVVGEIVNAAANEGEPLVYYRAGYHQLSAQ